MSTKNIKYISRERYLEKSEDMLLSLSDAYFNKKRFLLGEGVDKDKMIFYLQMNKSLCIKSCEIKDFIQDKINGKLQECGAKAEKFLGLSDCLRAIDTHLISKICNQSDIINECCGWETVEW